MELMLTSAMEHGQTAMELWGEAHAGLEALQTRGLLDTAYAEFFERPRLSAPHGKGGS